jgi:hypothetical protein
MHGRRRETAFIPHHMKRPQRHRIRGRRRAAMWGLWCAGCVGGLLPVRRSLLLRNRPSFWCMEIQESFTVHGGKQQRGTRDQAGASDFFYWRLPSKCIKGIPSPVLQRLRLLLLLLLSFDTDGPRFSKNSRYSLLASSCVAR